MSYCTVRCIPVLTASCTLFPLQVRAVVTAEDSSTVWIFTGSRDTTIKAWQDDGMHITEVSTLVHSASLLCALVVRMLSHAMLHLLCRLATPITLYR